MGNLQSTTNRSISAERPQITAQPNNKTDATKTATFLVQATGTDLSYQWERRPPGDGDDWQPVPTDDNRIKGANTPELSITYLQKSDEGSYRCTVTNRAEKIVSSPALLTLADPPQVVAQPQDSREVIPKQTLKLTIKSTGTETLKYSWEWNSSGVKVIDSVRRTTMEGRAASDAIKNFFDKLCREVTPEAVAPPLYAKNIIHRRGMIDAANNYKNVEDRAQALLLDLIGRVQARPQWFHPICDIFDEALIASTQDIRVEYQKILKEAEGWKPIPSDGVRYEGVHSATLTITSVQSSDQGGYRCIVSNDAGSETSEPAVVTVAEAPRIFSDPQQCEEVIPGEEVSMTIKAAGAEPLQYSWMYRPLDAIERGINAWSLAGGEGVQGADTPTLIISTAQESHQGRYRCVVSNLVGSETSSPGTLTLAKPPRIMSHPNVQQKIVPGRQACFTVEALGTQPLVYAWMWNSNESESAWLPVGGKEVQGADTPTLTITTAQESHQGRYRCVVSNLVGSETSSPGTLTLAKPPRIMSHPNVQQKIVPGRQACFTVEALGTQPLVYAWMWNSNESESAWLPVGGKEVQGADTPTLIITTAHESHQGRYRCVVSNIVGSETSNPGTLTLAKPPRIMSHPSVQQKIVPGRQACFTVEALGTQPLEYAWMWNSNESESAWLPVGGKEVQGADTPTLIITTAHESHQGRYRCVVSNIVGSETSNPALLSLEEALQISEGDESSYLEGTHWEKLQILGRGGFCECYLARDIKHNHYFAVKQICYACNTPSEQEEALSILQNEVDIQRRLKHPNIVKCFGAEHHPENHRFNIFVEWIPAGSLDQHLDKVGALAEPTVCNYTYQIVCGVAYLHENRVIHRDLKGANVLVDQTGRRVLIADFGTAGTMKSSKTMTGFKDTKGTIPFMAPEVIKATGYGRKCDVWSIGCVIIQMTTAKQPWKEKYDFEDAYALLFKIGSATEPPPIPSFENPLLKDLTVQCLRINPDDRPTTAELLKHPLFSGR